MSINTKEIYYMMGIFVLIVLLWVIFFNSFFLVSVNPVFAHSRGIRTLTTEFIFVTIIATIVTFSIQWVGLMVINSLLILPAATARNVVKSVRQYHVVAISISLISGLAGLLISFYTETATGATIVLVNAVIYICSLFIRKIL